TRNEADSSVYTTEKQLMEHKDKVPQEEQDAIRAAIAAVKVRKACLLLSEALLKTKSYLVFDESFG
ncbi:MAG: hypothetical protein SGPRY_010196, partial [Prymnesium sp.]